MAKITPKELGKRIEELIYFTYKDKNGKMIKHILDDKIKNKKDFIKWLNHGNKKKENTKPSRKV